MMLVRSYLAPSSIEGLGVFSHDNIKQGDLVWRFDPRIDQLIKRADLDAMDERTREFIDRYGYDMPHIPDCIALDADEGRFMNHADTPNLDFSSADVGVALCDIPAGVELTCNYREFTLGELVFQPTRHRVGVSLNGSA